ncbi:MAG: hypothetical protein NTZ73_00895 [Candidatus Diapherotrites archaeon]|nr:hypothetical protein [Candidatus Diapherotrites archaeon]
MENKVVSMKPVSLFEVKQVLKERGTEKELTYEQDQTSKFIEKFAKLTEKQTEDLISELKKIGPLKENEFLVYEILNVIPTRIEQLKLIIPKNVTMTDDEMKAVISLTEKFAEKVQ